MPRIFRVMKRGEDGAPVVGSAFGELGVRPGNDIVVDAEDHVTPATGGMSVNPDVAAIPPSILPKRYKPFGMGKNNCSVYEHGDGPFEQGRVAADLRLVPDHSKHGTVQPDVVMPISAYQAALAATRDGWRELP
ncbi:MAG: hypothetical protein IV100_17255 [Myxococcales bacterium]|nr:hypothetical protein [Myxococcales bacterium]